MNTMLLSLSLLVSHAQPPTEAPAGPTLISRLLQGNARFASGAAVHPHQNEGRRTDQAEGQKPFAVIVGCADSRVSPEIIFDQGIGDIFVVRVAGNVADTFALASIEYAVEHLGATHIMVLGHEKCGAVQAAVDTEKAIRKKAASGEGGSPAEPAATTEPAAAEPAPAPQPEDAEPEPTAIRRLIAEILPAVRGSSNTPGDIMTNSVRLNALMSKNRILERSKFLKHRHDKKEITMSSAVYNLHSGKVRVTGFDQ